MIRDILLCYSKLALLPTRSVSAKKVGLGLSVVEASKNGSREIHIQSPCSPSVRRLLYYWGRVLRNQECGT